MEIVVKGRQLLRDKPRVALDQRFQRIIGFERRLGGRASGRREAPGGGGHRGDGPGEKFTPRQKRRATGAAAPSRRRIYWLMEERHWRSLPKPERRNQRVWRLRS